MITVRPSSCGQIKFLYNAKEVHHVQESLVEVLCPKTAYNIIVSLYITGMYYINATPTPTQSLASQWILVHNTVPIGRSVDCVLDVLAGMHERVSNKTGKIDEPCYLKTYVCEPGKQYKIFTSLWIGFIVVYAVLVAVSSFRLLAVL